MKTVKSNKTRTDIYGVTLVSTLVGLVVTVGFSLLNAVSLVA